MRKAIVLLILALSANAEQKNVKLLTGLTDLELQRTMNLIRASMGTHCDYCHVIKEKWDFASDEKPAKRRARKMIQMVMDINRNSFDGQSIVSCYTCHRGSRKPLTLVELPQAAPPFPTPVHEEPQLLAAKDVVAKYAAALGDASRLKLPRVLKGERTNSQGTVAFELTDEPNPAFVLIAPSDIGEDARTVRKEKIGNADVWVVKNGNDRLSFDVNSGLLLRRVLLTPRAIGTIPQQTDYEDYRDAGGVKFPFLVRVSMVDPWTSATRKYTSVQLGAAQ